MMIGRRAVYDHFPAFNANDTSFFLPTNCSCRVQMNTNSSAPRTKEAEEFLMEVFPTSSLSPQSARNLTRLNLNRHSASEEMFLESVWTPEVIFRVTTISVLMFLTLVGNTALIYVITCQASLRRKRVSVFLLNLAFGDLMVCFVTMTTEILFVAFGEWVLGAAACKAIVYSQIVTLASTTFLLTAMSIDRYQVLVKPLQSLRGPTNIWRKMLLSWILAMVFATPQLFIFVQVQEQRPTDGKLILTCKSVGYTAEWQRKLYFSFMTTYILLIPTAIMSFCYFTIIRIVWARTGGGSSIDAPKIHFVTSRKATPKSVLGAPASNFRSNRLTLNAKAAMSSKRTVVKMTLSVIVGFVVCWTPYFVVSLIRIFTDYEIQMTEALSVSEIMALAHSALNPIVYMVFSTRALRNTCWQLRRGFTAFLWKSPSDHANATDWNPMRGSCQGVKDRNGALEARGRKSGRVFLTYTRHFLEVGNHLPQQIHLSHHQVANNNFFQGDALPPGDARTRTSTYVPRQPSTPSETVERTSTNNCYN